MNVLAIELKVSSEKFYEDKELKNAVVMFEDLFKRHKINFVKLDFCDCYSGKKLASTPLLPPRFLAVCLTDKDISSEALEMLEASIALLEAYKDKIKCPFKKQLVRKLLEEYWLVKKGFEMGGIARHSGWVKELQQAV
ncbi:MAG: hypothetical protein J7M03_02410 [Candidatus Desulfofervidaceae bacterium]|nr:hypothetical protein [Candidatus Desulfofervidaceae bacterium]